LELAMNPWSGDVDDLAYSQPVNLNYLKDDGFGSSFYGSGSNGRVTADNVELRQDAVDYSNWEIDKYLSVKVAQKYAVSFTPKILRKAADGTIVSETPKRGSIKMLFAIFRTNNESFGLNATGLFNPAKKSPVGCAVRAGNEYRCSRPGKWFC